MLKTGLTLRINATFLIGAVLLLAVFVIQHRGILRAARVQTIIGLASLVPLVVIGTVPILTGDVMISNFQPFAPREGDYFDLVELLRPSTVSRCYDRVVRIKVDEDVPEHKPVIISDPKLAAALNEAFDKLDRDQEQLFGEKIKYDDEHD